MPLPQFENAARTFIDPLCGSIYRIPDGIQMFHIVPEGEHQLRVMEIASERGCAELISTSPTIYLSFSGERVADVYLNIMRSCGYNIFPVQSQKKIDFWAVIKQYFDADGAKYSARAHLYEEQGKAQEHADHISDCDNCQLKGMPGDPDKPVTFLQVAVVPLAIVE